MRLLPGDGAKNGICMQLSPDFVQFPIAGQQAQTI
jgi:hypothetical protein